MTHNMALFRAMIVMLWCGGCQAAALCSSFPVDLYCYARGYNGRLIDAAASTYCAGPTCGAVDQATCCQRKASCAQFDAINGCTGGSYSGELILENAWGLTYCDGATCDNDDANTCCFDTSKAVCSSFNTEWCNDESLSGELVAAAATSYCWENPCKRLADRWDCCEMAARCSTLDATTGCAGGSYTGDLIPNARLSWCGGAVCDTNDAATCCQAAFAPMLVSGSEVQNALMGVYTWTGSSSAGKPLYSGPLSKFLYWSPAYSVWVIGATIGSTSSFSIYFPGDVITPDLIPSPHGARTKSSNGAWVDENLFFQTLLLNSTCSVINGSFANFENCACGTSYCDAKSGLFCTSSNNTCSQYAPCSVEDGSAVNSESCACGTSDCTSSNGLFCLASMSTCNTKLMCSVADGSSVNSGNCACGTNYCTSSSGLFCTSSTGTCSQYAPCSIVDGTAVNSENCACGTSDCTSSSGLFCTSSTVVCYAGTCKSTKNTCRQQGVFRPVNSGALKSAVRGCLQETADGSCPVFAAKVDANGNPYGVISDWDTSLVTEMEQLFQNAAAFNQDLSKWDTGQVQFFEQMFKNAHAFNSDVSKWDTSAMRSLNRMFTGATAFNSDLSKWDTSKVTEMYSAFYLSGFTRTLCGGAWVELGSNTGPDFRLGCCSPDTFMAQPNLNPFSQATACEACPSGQWGPGGDGDITSCNDNPTCDDIDGSGADFASCVVGTTHLKDVLSNTCATGTCTASDCCTTECATVPGGTCTSCTSIQASGCTAVKCVANKFDTNQDPTDGCEGVCAPDGNAANGCEMANNVATGPSSATAVATGPSSAKAELSTGYNIQLVTMKGMIAFVAVMFANAW